MKRNQVLQDLRQHLSAFERYGVKSLSIFGSVARDEANSKSDLDVLVEFNSCVTFDRYMDLKFYLEDHLGMSVDLVTKKMLKPQIRETVEQEAIHVA